VKFGVDKSDRSSELMRRNPVLLLQLGQQPEAAYFSKLEGLRSCYLVAHTNA
jgi:hypothetical protein